MLTKAVKKIKAHHHHFLPLATLLVLSACSSDQDLALGAEKAASDEAEITDEMIAVIKEVGLKKYPSGILKRFNQPKSVGCFDATMTVEKNLPDELRQGIFSKEVSYPAKLRFGNATKEDDTKKDFRGLSIKLDNVEGDSLWGENGQQDFTLNSYPALFAGTPKDFLAFINATNDDKVWRYFIHPSHFYSLMVVLKGRDKIDNPFAIRYWSTTPYRFGENKSKAVKYSVQSCSTPVDTRNIKKHPSFFVDVMTKQLESSSACFEFMLQFQTDPETMPIEDASVIWDEDQSPFVKVATITIDEQDFNSAENQKSCEAMTFNPWQSLEEHRPLGGINRVRRAVYSELGEFRTEENKQRGF